MNYIIYRVTNSINGRYYIGKHKTKNLDDGYLGSGKLIQQAIACYGREAFTKEILSRHSSEEDLNRAEKELVNETIVDDPLSYNLCIGGHGGFSYINRNGIKKFHGKKHTAETIQKILDARVNYVVTDETKQKMSEAMKRTNKSRSKKVSDVLKGKPKSQEHRRNISASLKGRKYKKRKPQKPRFVWKIETPNGNQVEVFNLTQFCKEHSINSKRIYKGVRGFKVLDKKEFAGKVFTDTHQSSKLK